MGTVYALAIDGSIRYIGSTTNLSNRLLSHLKKLSDPSIKEGNDPYERYYLMLKEIDGDLSRIELKTLYVGDKFKEIEKCLIKYHAAIGTKLYNKIYALRPLSYSESNLVSEHFPDLEISPKLAVGVLPDRRQATLVSAPDQVLDPVLQEKLNKFLAETGSKLIPTHKVLDVAKKIRRTHLSHLTPEKYKEYKSKKAKIFCERNIAHKSGISVEVYDSELAKLDHEYGIKFNHIKIGRKGHFENRKLTDAQEAEYRYWVTSRYRTIDEQLNMLKDRFGCTFDSVSGLYSMRRRLGISALKHKIKDKNHRQMRRSLIYKLRIEESKGGVVAVKQLKWLEHNPSEFTLENFKHEY